MLNLIGHFLCGGILAGILISIILMAKIDLTDHLITTKQPIRVGADYYLCNKAEFSEVKK